VVHTLKLGFKKVNQEPPTDIFEKQVLTANVLQ